MEPFLGEIRIFSFGLTPRGWLPCNGQILAIQQNTALFSLLGITYGGDGRTNFGLPDLRGRMQMGFAPGNQAEYRLGAAAGSESVALLNTQIPAHNHQVTAARSATVTDPAGGFLAGPAKPAFTTPGATTALAPDAVATVGGNQPHENMPPFTVINFCIAVQGVYPSRD